MARSSAKLVPPEDRTLSDLVVRQLRKQIILGYLKPGERLAEVRLAEQLGVSRGTLREALRRLEAESLVETTSHRGSRVACLEPADAYEICTLHTLLEEYCLRHAQLPLAESVRSELERIVDEMEALRFPEDVDRFIDLDHDFHKHLVRAAGQRRVLQVWKGLSSLLGVLVALSLRYLEEIDGAGTASRHRTIIEAVSQGNSDVAAGAIAAHYRSLAERIGEIASKRQQQGVGTA